MMQVYLSSNGQRTGPHSLESIQSWLQSGEINLTNPAWFEGCSSWVTVADIPGFNFIVKPGITTFCGETSRSVAYIPRRLKFWTILRTSGRRIPQGRSITSYRLCNGCWSYPVEKPPRPPH